MTSSCLATFPDHQTGNQTIHHTMEVSRCIVILPVIETLEHNYGAVKQNRSHEIHGAILYITFNCIIIETTGLKEIK